MARRKPKLTTETRVSVASIPLESARMLSYELADSAKLGASIDFKGAFVAAKVAAGFSNEYVAALKQRVLEAGALAVRVDKAKGAEPLVDQRVRRAKLPGIRAVVAALLEEAPSKDKDKLRSIIEAAISEAGI